MFTATQCGLQLIPKRFVLLAIPLLLPLALILLAGYAHAAAINELSAFETTTEFTVNSTNDTAVCDEITCTLRGAIVAANSQAGADTVAFSLPADSAINLSASRSKTWNTLRWPCRKAALSSFTASKLNCG